MMKIVSSRTILVILLLQLLVGWQSIPCDGGSSSQPVDLPLDSTTTPTMAVRTPKTKRLWSSMFTVDPSKILALLIDHAGIAIPKSAESDLKILRRVFHVEQAELNLVEKHLVLYNFTLGLNGRDALRIGRVFLHWDSYRKPCIDIEVDDVDVLVEYLNLLLTKSNWNELKETGFPPVVARTVGTQDSSTASDSWTLSSLLRFESIALSGHITVRISSRPLRRDIGVLSLGMDLANDLNKAIRELSQKNLREVGRRGCTIAELSALFQSYFGKKVRKSVASSLKEFQQNPKRAVKDADQHVREKADRLWATASDTFLDYATDATKKATGDIQNKVASRLAEWGVNQDVVKFVSERSIDSFSQVDANALKRKFLSFPRRTFRDGKRRREATTRKAEETKSMPSDIMFADW